MGKCREGPKEHRVPLAGGKEAGWNSRKGDVFLNVKSLLIKHYCDDVALFWRMTPFFRPRWPFQRLQKRIASEQIHLVSPCGACEWTVSSVFEKPSASREANRSNTSWSCEALFHLATPTVFGGAMVHDEFHSLIFFLPGISGLLLTFGCPIFIL